MARWMMTVAMNPTAEQATTVRQALVIFVLIFIGQSSARVPGKAIR
jgi:hypothetical protein